MKVADIQAIEDHLWTEAALATGNLKYHAAIAANAISLLREFIEGHLKPTEDAPE